MKSRYLLFTLLLGCATQEPKLLTISLKGLDILGLPRQNTAMVKRYLEPGEGIGTFHGPFGPAIKSLDAILATGKPSFFRVHFDFCGHGSHCGPGECRPSDLPCMGKKADAVEGLARKYPGVRCLISPYAEYSSTNRTQVDSWFNILRGRAPSCTPVASSFGGYVPSGVLVEKHGNKPGVAAITSNDGEDAFQSNSPLYNSYATSFSLIWTPRMNLRLSSEKSPPPPPMQRPLSNRLRKEDLLQLQLLQLPEQPKPSAPAVCHSVRELRAPEIEKSNPEDYPVNDSREKAPLFILPKKVARYDLLAPSGVKIGCAKYYGPYSGGGHRYYVGNCSPNSRLGLYKKAQGEWMYLKNKNTCFLVSTIRRKGTYR